MRNKYRLFKLHNPEVKALAKNDCANPSEQAGACMALAEVALEEAQRIVNDNKVPYKELKRAYYIYKSNQWFKQAGSIYKRNNQLTNAELAEGKAEVNLPALTETVLSIYR